MPDEKSQPKPAPSSRQPEKEATKTDAPTPQQEQPKPGQEQQPNQQQETPQVPHADPEERSLLDQLKEEAEQQKR